jgi:integrase
MSTSTIGNSQINASTSTTSSTAPLKGGAYLRSLGGQNPGVFIKKATQLTTSTFALIDPLPLQSTALISHTGFGVPPPVAPLPTQPALQEKQSIEAMIEDNHIRGCALTAAQASLLAPSAAFRMIDPKMTFHQASDRFLELRRAPRLMGRVQYQNERTFRDLEQNIKRLNIFFGEMVLEEINVGLFGDYQHARAAGDGFTRKLGKEVVTSIAGSNKINSELSLMIRIMKYANCWTPLMAQYYQRLQRVDTEFQPALTPEQQDRFLATAALRPEWEVVYWYTLVALHTTFSSDEMRTIRQGDINLNQAILGVNRRYAKNRFRRREVPLEDPDCIWALQRLLERAGKLVGNAPSAYLFPFRERKGHYVAEQPMGCTGIRKAFQEVRAAAGLPWFKLNGMRHTAITRFAEAGTPIVIIMRRAGHITPAMSAHYTHISEQAERQYVARSAERKRGNGYTGRV